MSSPPKTPPPSSKFNLRKIDLKFSCKNPFLITKVPQIHEPAMPNETKNTENRLKNLKKGDPVYIRSCYECHEANGNILTTHYYVLSKEKQIKMHTCSTPENVLLPSALQPAPKYDPCRLLRKGDRVQVKKRNGRCNGKNGEYLREAFCEVAEDEVPNELVRVYHNSS